MLLFQLIFNLKITKLPISGIGTLARRQFVLARRMLIVKVLANATAIAATARSVISSLQNKAMLVIQLVTVE